MIINITNHNQVYKQGLDCWKTSRPQLSHVSGEYCNTPGAFLIDIERIIALLPIEELMMHKPDLQKLMALVPNFEDFEELIIKRLDCGGRGTVSIVLTMVMVASMPVTSPPPPP